MCGFVGLFSTAEGRPADLDGVIRRMTGSLEHRGPDDSGIWIEDDTNLALGFRRLSIIDTSPSGHQPMISASGRYVLVFNGEVYNHEELRQEILSEESFPFQGHSDTEVILAAFQRWGIQAAIGKFIGMFAMAVWDRNRREITLIRDRLGVKPLYIYQKAGLVLFGSELKGLLECPGFDKEVDAEALGEYFRYLYIPTPRTPFVHAQKLLPGSWVTVRDPGSQLPLPTRFWSLSEAVKRVVAQPQVEPEALLEGMEVQLREAVRSRLRSDVPVGALLSGGVDSSLVVALMQEQSAAPVRTFCIGFDDPVHDESRHAAAVANHLGTIHTQVDLSGGEVLNSLDRVVDIFDEPYANPSHLPTLLLCEAVRGDVTVALAGDGGDEVFGGYNRYRYGRRALPWIQRTPAPIRGILSTGLKSVPPRWWDRAYEVARLLAPGHEERLIGEKVQKVATLLRTHGEVELYRSLLSAWQEPGSLMGLQGREPDHVDAGFEAMEAGDLLSRMQFTDQVGYLPDDLLHKVDRVSMAVSLEVRVPLIDHKVVEYSWSLPGDWKIRDQTSKWILREILYRRVPRALIDRPKTGFSAPVKEWLRGPLNEWANDLLSPDGLAAFPLLDGSEVRRTWDAFLRGRGELASKVWTVLMFRTWYDRWAG